MQTEAQHNDGKSRALQTIPVTMDDGGQGRLTGERESVSLGSKKPITLLKYRGVPTDSVLLYMRNRKTFIFLPLSEKYPKYIYMLKLS